MNDCRIGISLLRQNPSQRRLRRSIIRRKLHRLFKLPTRSPNIAVPQRFLSTLQRRLFRGIRIRHRGFLRRRGSGHQRGSQQE